MADPANALSALPQSFQTLVEACVGIGTIIAAAYGYVKMKIKPETNSVPTAMSVNKYEQNLRLILEDSKTLSEQMDGVHKAIDSLTDDMRNQREIVLTELKDRERENRDASNRLYDKIDRGLSDLANAIRQR